MGAGKGKKLASRKRDPGQSGQSTVEFALTLILIMAFVFFFLQLAMVLAWGNFVHYATFMSARAYQSAGSNPDDQRERAVSVLTRMVKKSESAPGTDRLAMIGKGDGGEDEIKGAEIGAHSQFSGTDRAKSWLEGVRYTFKSRLFLIPMGGNASGGPGLVNAVKLTSESWLGRETTYEECQTVMGKKGIYDNGC
ncbi:MAG: TadE family protein [Bdellovibrionota bacterium]